MPFVPTPQDSAVVAGWLVHALAPVLGNLPASISAFVIASVVSLIFHFAEQLLTTYGAKVPGLSSVVAAWQARKPLLNPLLVMLLGWLTSGSPLIGVLAAGLRSFVKKPTAGSVAGSVGAGALALMLMLPSNTSAAETVPRLLHYDFTLGERWLDAKRLDVAPVLFADAAVRYILPFRSDVVAKVKVRHDLKDWSDRPWQLEGGLTYSF